MDIIFDKTGFPMVKVIPGNFWIHVWPVTKIQFEAFICDKPNSEMDSSWYKQILSNNPRITPTRISSKNYWQLFIAGVHPDKVQMFSEWNGKGFAIPTASEWHAAYKYFSEQETTPDKFFLNAKDSNQNNDPLVNIINNKLNEVLSEFSKKNGHNLADQLFMRRGMVEWVKLIGESGEWGGMGEPNPLSNWSTTAIVSQGRPEIVRNLNVKHYGFRLIKKL